MSSVRFGRTRHFLFDFGLGIAGLNVVVRQGGRETFASRKNATA
jgi:hypothetical protein